MLEGLSGTIQISDLCKKYGIKSARYYYWKEELIIRSALMRKQSLEKMILGLEKLHVVEDASGSINKLERTRKQKDILEALEKVSWW